MMASSPVPTVRLDALADVRLGRQRSPKNHSGDQMRPYVRAANVGWKGLLLDDVKEMNFSDDEMETYRLVKNDILLNEASGSPSGVGKPAIWKGEITDCAFQNTLIRVRPRTIDAEYLLQYFRYVANRGLFAAAAKGVGIRHLGREVLSSWPIPCPDEDEQRRIVGTLEQADVLRAKRREAIADLDELLRSTFFDTFGDPVANQKAWPHPHLGDKTIMLQYGPRFYDESYVEDGMRIVRITDLDESGRLDFGSMPRMSVTEAERRKFRLDAGDIIFARTGATVGKLALIRKSDPECIAGAYFIRMKFDKDVVPEYAVALLRTRSIGKIIWTGSQQSAQQNFSGPGLRALPFPLPPLELQQSFADLVSAVSAVREEQVRSATALDEMFAVLQYRAFRGEL